MGQGVTSTVVHCWDYKEGKSVVVKILRAGAAFTNEGQKEVEYLKVISKRFLCKAFIGEMRYSFVYKNHYCIVFEKLGPSLDKVMEMNKFKPLTSQKKKNKFKPLSIGLVRLLGRQLLECVYYIHSMGLLHTDLKPSNVVLIHDDLKLANSLLDKKREFHLEPRLVKLIDFSCATCSLPGKNYVISAPAYHAPEVILGFDWYLPCDMWSVGCILLELCSGTPFFLPNNDPEHLSMMDKVLGHPVPKHMMDEVNFIEEERGRKVLEQLQEDVSRVTLEALERMPRLEDFVKQLQFDDMESGDKFVGPFATPPKVRPSGQTDG